MNRLIAVTIGLLAFGASSVSCVAEEPAGSSADRFRYAKLNSGDVRSSVRVGPFDAPFDAPERKPYPERVTLAKSHAQPRQVASVNTSKRTSGISILDSAGAHFTETITVFGERIVPPTEVSGLEHISVRGAKYESDEFQWTFKRFYGESGKYLFGSDFLFRYRYPTEGAGPRGFRSGDLVVGFAVTVPLTRFAPLGSALFSK